MAIDLSTLLSMSFWSATTIACYYAAKSIYRRGGRHWWISPLMTAPIALLLLAFASRTTYQDYIRGTHWLVLMLGPTTVAFAVPIFRYRTLIQRHWPTLVTGVAIGSSTAILGAWTLATLLHLSPQLRLSLLPRSITTPFAMAVSGDVGGIPELTAVFVVLTGLCGAALGQILLRFLPLRSALARGALFGMGAHGIGVATAREIGEEEGSVAGLVMVLAGLTNVVVAPFLIRLL